LSIAVLHLSDIHFTDSNNPVNERIKKIVNAVVAHTDNVEACLIAVTGDVANTGKSTQYALASAFFSALMKALVAERSTMSIEFVFVPGNHDCNLDRATEVRALLIDNMPSRLSSLEPSSDIVRQCLEVQDEFFDFEAHFLGSSRLEGGERLFYGRTFNVVGRRLKFNCYNTAWLAQIGKTLPPLLYPVSIATRFLSEEEGAYDYIFSLFHYPYTWLEPNNSKEFKTHVDVTSDYILSGHEHSASSYSKQYTTGSEVFYIEGAALQETGKRDSGFNLLKLDFDTNKQETMHFEWKKDIYSPVKGLDSWKPLTRNSLIKRKSFEVNSEYYSFLIDVGTGFTHPRKQNLFLRDLFVYPDLREEQFDKKLESKEHVRNIEGEEIINYVFDRRWVVITGARESGKTTLSKILYEDLNKRGLYALGLRARDVNGVTKDQVYRVTKRAFEEQYDPQSYEYFHQIDSDEKVLIIDNFHNCRLNATGQNEFLRNARELFGRIVLFADDVFHLEVLTSKAEESDALRDFSHCTIRPSGYRRRKHLIEKWLILGQEFTISSEELAEERRRFEGIINAVIGKGLLPAYPVLVLSILQITEATKSHNVGAGSQGYIYEALITEALTKLSAKASDLGKLYVFLSHIAYEMFYEEQQALTLEEIQHVADRYHDRFGIRFGNIETLVGTLSGAGILRLERGAYRLYPTYYYYYFVARYFRENLNDLRHQAHEMVDTVHFEEYAQVLVFLIYLTKDPDLIDRIAENAAEIYKEFPPCNLGSDVEFINLIATPKPRRELPATDTDENVENHRRTLDELDDQEDSHRRKQANEKVKYSSDADDLVKLNIAFKTMDLMGQVVRNFPYDLVGETKDTIVKECELLGLRTLGAVLGIAGENVELLKDYYHRVIQARRAFISEAEADLEAANFVYWLMSAVGYGIIKRVSQAVGAEELHETFKRVLDSLEPKLAIRVIDVAIKLDHYRGAPIAEVEALNKELGSNVYTSSLLRDMVGDYLYLFHVDQAIKQKLANIVDIQITDPSLYDGRFKRLPRTTSEKK
jgi:DNA repair exonuclease SbcCD nuclease subunit